MKLKFIISLVLCLFFCKGYTQEIAPQISWQKTYNSVQWDYINTMIQTSDGGFVLACSSVKPNTKNNDNINIWIVKTDIQGNIQWQKSFGGKNRDQVVRIIEGINGGYVFTGQTYSADGDIPAGKYHGGGDAWVVKIDTSGVIEWQQVLGGSKFDCGNNIIATPDNCYLMVGTTSSQNGDLAYSKGKGDVLLVKLNATGKVLWSKTYGGSDVDYGSNVINVSSGGYLVSAVTFSHDADVSGNHGKADLWLIKVDENGKIDWQKCFGGNQNDFGGSLIENAEHDFVICGTTYSTDGNIKPIIKNKGDYWVIKIGSKGELLWQKTYGGSGYDNARTVIQSTDSNYIISGISDSKDGDILDNKGDLDCWLIKINNDGNLIWQKNIGGVLGDSCNYIMNTMDGGYAIDGSTSSEISDSDKTTGAMKGWLVKIDKELQTQDIPNNLSIGNKIKIFPTITYDNINILMPDELESSKIFITNPEGKKMDFNGDLTGKKRKLVFRNYKPGTYTLSITDQHSVYTYKFIIVR